MIRRYDLRRSDNFWYTGRISYVCSGNGTLNVWTGFPVTRATVSFATLPPPSPAVSTSSSSSSSSLSDSEIESPTSGYPRIYVSAYSETGFEVTYEHISSDVGYIEFTYAAV